MPHRRGDDSLQTDPDEMGNDFNYTLSPHVFPPLDVIEGGEMFCSFCTVPGVPVAVMLCPIFIGQSGAQKSAPKTTGRRVAMFTRGNGPIN